MVLAADPRDRCRTCGREVQVMSVNTRPDGSTRWVVCCDADHWDEITDLDELARRVW